MEGSVYDIRHKTNLDLQVYVGSTKNFSQRKKDHKRDCNKTTRKGHNYRVYKYIRANGGWEAWEMTEIYYGSQFRELEKELLKEHFEECINSDMTGRTQAEWQSEYRKKNKERLNKWQSQKIKCNKCGKMSSRCNLARHQRSAYCINYTSSSTSSSESESE